MKKSPSICETYYFWIIPFILGLSKSKKVIGDMTIGFMYTLHITPLLNLGFDCTSTKKTKKCCKGDECGCHQEPYPYADEVILHQDEHGMVVVPLSHLASCKHGSGTKWTSAQVSTPDLFYMHTDCGEFIYFIRYQDNQKYGMYYDARINEKSYFDQEDNQIEKPEWMENFDGIIDKYIATGLEKYNIEDPDDEDPDEVYFASINSASDFLEHDINKYLELKYNLQDTKASIKKSVNISVPFGFNVEELPTTIGQFKVNVLYKPEEGIKPNE